MKYDDREKTFDIFNEDDRVNYLVLQLEKASTDLLIRLTNEYLQSKGSKKAIPIMPLSRLPDWFNKNIETVTPGGVFPLIALYNSTDEYCWGIDQEIYTFSTFLDKGAPDIFYVAVYFAETIESYERCLAILNGDKYIVTNKDINL